MKRESFISSLERLKQLQLVPSTALIKMCHLYTCSLHDSTLTPPNSITIPLILSDFSPRVQKKTSSSQGSGSGPGVHAATGRDVAWQPSSSAPPNHGTLWEALPVLSRERKELPELPGHPATKRGTWDLEDIEYYC